MTEDNKFTKDELIQLLIKGQLDEVVDLLPNVCNNDSTLKETQVLLKSQIRELRTRELQGVITEKESSVLKNLLIKKILRIIEDKEVLDDESTQPKYRRRIIVFLLGVLLLIIYQLFSSYKPDREGSVFNVDNSDTIDHITSKIDSSSSLPQEKEGNRKPSLVELETSDENKIIKGVSPIFLDYSVSAEILKSNKLKGFPVYFVELSSDKETLVHLESVRLTLNDFIPTNLDQEAVIGQSKLFDLENIIDVIIEPTQKNVTLPLIGKLSVGKESPLVIKIRFSTKKGELLIPPSALGRFNVSLHLVDQNEQQHTLLEKVEIL